jgi:hypothetical protein
MGLRWACILAACLGLVSPDARGGELRRMSCTLVRFYVAKYSAPAAEQYARSKGATDAEIELARHCIKPETAQTASIQPVISH